MPQSSRMIVIAAACFSQRATSALWALAMEAKQATAAAASNVDFGMKLLGEGVRMPTSTLCRALAAVQRPALRLREPERDGVDAVPQAGGFGAVTEQVAQVRVAAAARHLTLHGARAGLAVHHVFFGDGLPVAGPSGSGVELV